MFGMGVPELVVIMVIALLVFGPGRLPEIGGALGKGIRDFKKGFDGEGDEEAPKKVEEQKAAKTTVDEPTV